MARRAGRPTAPTIKMVAVAAGVATSTVSRVYSHPHLLRVSTVSRVKQVADELGYVPHYSARALSIGRLGTIGVIVPDVANPFFPPIIRAVQARAREDGLCTLLADTDEDSANELELLSTLAQRTDGVVLASSRLPEEVVRERAGRHPLVLINRDVDGVPRVLIDTASGMRDAVDHLVDLGHRELVYVSGPESSWSDQQRRSAVLEQCARRRVYATVLGSRRPEHEEGRLAVPEIIRSGASAVIAFDDMLAQGVLAGLLELGIDVPGQVSIVGCDDILAVRTVPPLTTIRGASSKAGAEAVKLLLAVIDPRGTESGSTRQLIQTALVLRGTTRRCRLSPR